MISNERQYRITRKWLERFEQARAGVDEQGNTLAPRARQALRDQYDSQIEELRAQVVEYEALRNGRVAVVPLDSLDQLPDALIHARIAAGLTQRELANRLGLKQQQIQRYEATHYAGVRFDRLRAIASALGVTTHGQIALPTTGREPEPARS